MTNQCSLVVTKLAKLCFMPNYVSGAAPVSDLGRRDSSLIWGEEVPSGVQKHCTSRRSRRKKFQKLVTAANYTATMYYERKQNNVLAT